jgi:hypothetical protein
MLLGATGLLRGSPAVTNRRALDDLRGFGADDRLGTNVAVPWSSQKRDRAHTRSTH